MTMPVNRLNLLASMLLGLIIILTGISIMLLWPLSLADLKMDRNSAKSYDEAIRKYDELRATEAGLPLSTAGHSLLLTHGAPTRRVVVLLHGLTNCPEQFRELGEALFAAGANVIIPRLAHHGLADRMNTEQGSLRATDLLQQAATGIDIATGLGEKITVVGLSVSGVTAGWLAGQDDRVDAAFLLSPFFGILSIPAPFTPILANAASRLPNGFVWWDGKVKENLPGSPYVYPRFATRQIGETLRLGLAVAHHNKPLVAKKVGVILSESDLAVNNVRTLGILDRWKSTSPNTTFFLHIFPASEKVQHDFVDPFQPGSQTARTNPMLVEWLMNPDGSAQQ